MRALVYDDKGVRLDERQASPQPREGDALVRLTQAAISRDDVAHAASKPGASGVLGTRFVGVVESITGPMSHLIKKRVVGFPMTFCGSCDMCTSGLSRHCRKRMIFGMYGADGCLAERFVIPAKNLLQVPDNVDDDHAVFTVDLASSLHAAEQLTIVGKPYITVLGDGTLAMLTSQVMSRLNASVRLIGNQFEHLALCEKWGLKHRHADDIGRHADQDVVVDCTHSPAGLELAMKLVRPRGTIVLKSLREKSGIPEIVDLSPIVRNEIELVGSLIGPMSEALLMLGRNEVDVVSLISRRMKLADGPAIFNTANRAGVLSVLVEP